MTIAEYREYREIQENKLMLCESSGQIARAKRRKLGYTLEYLSELTGITHGYLSMWETGKRILGETRLRRVAKVLDLDPDRLQEIAERERYKQAATRVEARFDDTIQAMGLDSVVGTVPGDMIAIPILGTVPGGEAIRIKLVEMKSPESSIMLPEELIVSKDMTFALWVKGNSMAGRVEDGDIVVVQKGTMPENGDLAVVRLHDEVTVKVVEIIEDIILLRSTNPDIPPIYITQKDKDGFEIIGKVIGTYSQNP